MTIKIGVGLNTGACCVGNLGSEQRFSYSAIGDSVNVAARVESLTKQYGLPILITEYTVRACIWPGAARGRSRPRRRPRRAASRFSRCSATRPIAVSPEFPATLRRRTAACSRPTARAISPRRRSHGGGAESRPAVAHSVYDVYAKRIATLRENPPPEPWDGVFTALEK